jgi:hypothetical protein
MQDRDEERSASVAVEAPITDWPQMDVALLHCQACLLPLKSLRVDFLSRNSVTPFYLDC